MSCYEAGRDGFWLHRYLVEAGVENLVADSSSIQVDRRFRRAKTDRMDVAKLLDLLMRYERARRRCGAWSAYLGWERRTAGTCTGSWKI